VIYVLPHTWFEFDSTLSFESNYIQKVKPILDSILKSMIEDYWYKFNWAETVYFKEWYLHLDKPMWEKVTQFVNEGRFYFVGGASTESLSSYLPPSSII